MIKKSAAYLFFWIVYLPISFVTIGKSFNKDTMDSVSNDIPRYFKGTNLFPSKTTKQLLLYCSNFLVLPLLILLKSIKKSTKHPLLEPIKLNDNFPEVNSKTFLKIPTPYDDGTMWSGRTNQATHPSVIQFEEKWNDYKYWMTYTPYPYGNNKKENPSLVASHDGIKWVVPAKVINPIVSIKVVSGYLFDSYLSDSHLVYNNDSEELELWYRYVSNRCKSEILYRVKSKDTIQWTAPEKLIDDSNNLLQYVSPSIVYEENKYRMWVMRDWYIFYLESSDGKEWCDAVQVYAKNKPIHSWHPHVCKIGEEYHLLNNENTTNTGAGGKIYHSTSSDGIHFTKKKLVLGFTGNGLSYDSTGVYRASMTTGEKGWYLYYGQVSNAYQWTIGLSIGPDLNKLAGINDMSLNL